MQTLAPVVDRHYQLICWLLPKLANFPKDQRFLLADRIENHMLDILEMLLEAMFAKNRREILVRVNLKLDVLRLLMRMARDMRYVSLNGYDHYCQCLLEIGRMVGGWQKSAARSE